MLNTFNFPPIEKSLFLPEKKKICPHPVENTEEFLFIFSFDDCGTHAAMGQAIECIDKMYR